MSDFKLSISERFWNLVDIKDDNDCWYWKAGKNKSGYGLFRVGRRNIDRGVISAHRYALLGDNAKVDKRIVCHTCDHPACCNPNHLYLGTQLDNEQDIRDRNPTAKSMYKRKLYSGEVWLIKKLSKGGISQDAIAPMFRVSQATISRAISNPNHLTKDI